MVREGFSVVRASVAGLPERPAAFRRRLEAARCLGIDRGCDHGGPDLCRPPGRTGRLPPVPVTSLLDLTLRPDAVASAPDVLRTTLAATRAFPGCLGVDVLVDDADETHVVAVEQWESMERDDAYRAWRATPAGASDLASVLAAPPRLIRLTPLPGT